MKTVTEKVARRRLGPVGKVTAEAKMAALRAFVVGAHYQHKSGHAPPRRVLEVREEPRRTRVSLGDGKTALAKLPSALLVLEGGLEVWADELRRLYRRVEGRS